MSRKYALIIGNTEYIDSGLAQLTAPGKDTEDFARVLKDQEICAFDEVKVVFNQPEHIVRGAVDEFFDQKKPDDLLVLYFSGHGVRDEMGSLYLAVQNTIRNRLRSTAIKSDYIREAMDGSRSKRQILILDCCNSGAFPQGTKAELGGVMGMTKAFQGYGRFVLMASDATQFAWEGNTVIGKTQNSLFTHFLVKGLEGEADRDSNGKITVDELYDYTYEEISRVTPKQTPTKSASKQEGEIVLREIIRLEDIKPVTLPEQLISEIENPYPEVRLRAVQQLEKIIEGKHLGLARSAREALERLEKEDDSHRVVLAAKQALASAGPVGDTRVSKIEESGKLAKNKVEDGSITQPGMRAVSKIDVREGQHARERIEAIQAARKREQLERQLKLQQRATTMAEPEKKVKEQEPKSRLGFGTALGLGGIAALLLACILGSVYVWRNLPIVIPPSSSSTPDMVESSPTRTLLPTETQFIAPTTVSTTEAPPTSTSTNTLPQLFLPGNISREGDTIGGAVVSYQVSATDPEDGSLPVDCAPRSGSLFSVGSTVVNCSAIDSQGEKTTASFTIEVKDTTPPTIASHGDEEVQSTSASGAIVNYVYPATSDIVDGSGTATCSPSSGTQFRIGRTPVECNANDLHGNPASKTTFEVHVTANGIILVSVYWDRDNDAEKTVNDGLLWAVAELYPRSSCSGPILDTSGPNWVHVFDGLEPGTYCVKVINDSINNGGECAVVPRNNKNTTVYNLSWNQRIEDTGIEGYTGFPYVCR